MSPALFLALLLLIVCGCGQSQPVTQPSASSDFTQEDLEAMMAAYREGRMAEYIRDGMLPQPGQTYADVIREFGRPDDIDENGHDAHFTYQLERTAFRVWFTDGFVTRSAFLD